jgi:hypothetical protein
MQKTTGDAVGMETPPEISPEIKPSNSGRAIECGEPNLSSLSKKRTRRMATDSDETDSETEADVAETLADEQKALDSAAASIYRTHEKAISSIKSVSECSESSQRDDVDAKSGVKSASVCAALSCAVLSSVSGETQASYAETKATGADAQTAKPSKKNVRSGTNVLPLKKRARRCKHKCHDKATCKHDCCKRHLAGAAAIPL